MSETLSPSLPPKVDRLALQVARAACDRQLRIVTAESCTGGMLASLLTDIEGCAHAFERGFVTYAKEAKHELLGVPQAILKQHGAVSAPVARAMAVGALAASKAHVALSITGFAGRGAPGDEPGLVYFGRAGQGRAADVVEKRFGDIGRGGVRLACLETALELLLDAVGPTLARGKGDLAVGPWRRGAGCAPPLRGPDCPATTPPFDACRVPHSAADIGSAIS